MVVPASDEPIATHGASWRLRGDIVLANGTGVEFDLRCRMGPGESLRWTARYFFDAVGLSTHTKETAVHIRYKSFVGQWDARLRLLGFLPEFHRGESMEALRRRGEWSMINGAEQDYWLSTTCVVVALQLMHKTRKAILDRERVRLLFVKILSRTSFGEGLAQCFDVSCVPADVAASCEVMPRDASGRCRCLSSRLRAHSALAMEMECVRTCETLLSDTCVLECAATASHIGSWIRELASLIDSSVTVWGDASVPMEVSLGPSGKKRRRIDPEIRDYILARAAGGQCSAGVGGVGKEKFDLPSSTTQTLKLTYLSDQRAACLALMGTTHGQHTIASTFDGARVGKPAVDMLMHLIWDSNLQKCFVAAPKD